MKNYLSTNLKFLRIQNGYTQEHLADLMNKDYSTVGKWENGTRSPITEDTIRISEIFKVPLDKLLLHDLRIKNEEIQENKLEKDLKKFAIDNGVELSIDKNKKLSAESALKIQSMVQNILFEELEKHKN